MAGAAWRALLLLLLLASALAVQKRSETLGAHTYQWPPNSTVNIPVYMSSLFSARTQFAYPYYGMKFFCEPKQGDTPKANLGDALLGTTFASSGYEVNLIQDLSATSTGCMVLCRIDPTPAMMANVKSYVESGYTVHWYISIYCALSS